MDASLNLTKTERHLSPALRAYDSQDLKCLLALYGLTQAAMNLQPRYKFAPTAIIDVGYESGRHQTSVPCKSVVGASDWCSLRIEDARGVADPALCFVYDSFQHYLSPSGFLPLATLILHLNMRSVRCKNEPAGYNTASPNRVSCVFYLAG